MFAITLPGYMVLGERPGVIVGDDETYLVVWKGGELRLVETFSNDEDGLANFRAYLARNPYRNKGFFVLANVIGEDYRFEQVAHLSGNLRAGLHNRRMRQLFRGSNFFMSEVHGREPEGKREDIVLFFGILSAGKIEPWLAAIDRGGERYVTGVHAMPHLVACLLPLLPKPSKDSVVVTFHEGDTMRLTFFSEGKVRFGRYAKAPPDSGDGATMGAAVKKELERTLQYLNTQRAFSDGQLTVDCICPAELKDEMEQALPSTGRLEYRFHSAEAINQKAGVKKPAMATGRDSSLMVDALAKRVVIRQLAPQANIRHYWIQLGAKVAMALICTFGAYSYANAALTFSGGFLGYAAQNESIEKALRGEQGTYERELSEIGQQPSSARNVRAVASVFDATSAKALTPTRLLYYLSGALTENEGVSLDSVKWYIAPGAIDPASNGTDIIGDEGEIYQILEITGSALGNSQREVAARAREFTESFRAQGDIFVEVQELPPETVGLLLGDGVLNRTFAVRIIWRDGVNFPEDFNPRGNEGDEEETG